LIVKKYYLKQFKEFIVKCPKWDGILGVKFCEKCSLFKQNLEDSIECNFKPKLEFQKKMEIWSNTSLKDDFRHELKNEIAKNTLITGFVDIVVKKEIKEP
jgi:hypothetical protein